MPDQKLNCFIQDCTPKLAPNEGNERSWTGPPSNINLEYPHLRLGTTLDPKQMRSYLSKSRGSRYRCVPGLAERGLRFVDVAPSPSRWRRCAHDRMLRCLEMLGRVFAGRGVAAADVTARLTLAQRYPHRSFAQALLASIGSFLRRKILARQSVQVFTCIRHDSLQERLFPAVRVATPPTTSRLSLGYLPARQCKYPAYRTRERDARVPHIQESSRRHRRQLPKQRRE
jgi:hypothetical protein